MPGKSNLIFLCIAPYSFDFSDTYDMISHGQGGPKNMIPAMVTDIVLKTDQRTVSGYPI